MTQTPLGTSAIEAVASGYDDSIGVFHLALLKDLVLVKDGYSNIIRWSDQNPAPSYVTTQRPASTVPRINPTVLNQPISR